MADKQTTTMLLKVDLQCGRCYKKVKKVLCKFPQIHDQIYNEKQNTVTIKVVCCCPEKIMQKIRCKGGASIMCIEIVPPPKPKPPPVEKHKPPPDDPKPPPPEQTKSDNKPPPSEPPKVHVLVPTLCPPAVYPIRDCCRECSEGRSGGPCFHGHGQLPPPCYVGYGTPVYDSYGGGWPYRGCYVSRSDYFCEEYPSGCTVM